MNIDTDRPSLTEREAIAHSMRGSGFSLVEIASKMGVSPSRARALWLNAKNKHEEWDKWKSHPLFGLSVRTMNCLIFSGIDTREKAIEALTTGVYPRGPKIYDLARSYTPKRANGLVSKTESKSGVGGSLIHTQGSRSPNSRNSAQLGASK